MLSCWMLCNCYNNSYFLFMNNLVLQYNYYEIYTIKKRHTFCKSLLEIYNNCIITTLCFINTVSSLGLDIFFNFPALRCNKNFVTLLRRNKLILLFDLNSKNANSLTDHRLFEFSLLWSKNFDSGGFTYANFYQKESY